MRFLVAILLLVFAASSAVAVNKPWKNARNWQGEGWYVTEYAGTVRSGLMSGPFWSERACLVEIEEGDDDYMEVSGLTYECENYSSRTPLALQRSDLVGTWRCGPTVVRAPTSNVTSVEEVTWLQDGTYSSHASTVISEPGQDPLAIEERYHGTWKLDGDVAVTRVQRIEVLSALHPSITKERWQKSRNHQLAVMSLFASRILEMQDGRMRTTLVHPAPKGSAIEVSCQRQ